MANALYSSLQGTVISLNMSVFKVTNYWVFQICAVFLKLIFNVEDTSLGHIVFKCVHFASIFLCVYGAKAITLICSHFQYKKNTFTIQREPFNVNFDFDFLFVQPLILISACLNLIQCDFEVLKFCIICVLLYGNIALSAVHRGSLWFSVCIVKVC